jgi:hypothetical protein
MVKPVELSDAGFKDLYNANEVNGMQLKDANYASNSKFSLWLCCQKCASRRKNEFRRS